MGRRKTKGENTIVRLKYRLEGNWLQVCKEDGSDGIGWDELQALKNEVLGAEVRAIEIYPPQSEVVNLINVRHLWVLPEDVKLPDLRQVLKEKGYL